MNTAPAGWLKPYDPSTELRDRVAQAKASMQSEMKLRLENQEAIGDIPTDMIHYLKRHNGRLNGK